MLNNMANSCYNNVTFTGPAENIANLRKLLELFIQLHPDNYVEDSTFDMAGFCEVLQIEDAGTRWLEVNYYDNTQVDSLNLSGDTAWRPMDKAVQRLCLMYKVSAELEYEENGDDFKGKDTFDEDGNWIENCYGYWEGMAILEPEDYVERAKSDIDCELFESSEDFFNSSLWNYCPDGLKEEVRSAFFSYISEQEDNELSVKSSTDV